MRTQNSKGGQMSPREHPVAEHVKLPDTRQAIVHKFSVDGHKGYIAVGLYDDGKVGEIFLTIAKEGSTISGWADLFAVTASLALQHGVPLEKLVSKWMHVRFEPQGFTTNTDIPLASSVVDYIAKWLTMRFLEGTKLDVELPASVEALNGD